VIRAYASEPQEDASEATRPLPKARIAIPEPTPFLGVLLRAVARVAERTLPLADVLCARVRQNWPWPALAVVWGDLYRAVGTNRNGPCRQRSGVGASGRLHGRTANAVPVSQAGAVVALVRPERSTPATSTPLTLDMSSSFCGRLPVSFRACHADAPTPSQPPSPSAKPCASNDKLRTGPLRT
jgi:hypothetical protein